MPNRAEFKVERDRFGKRISNFGIRGVVQIKKRMEADERNARTPHNRTKAHRLERCEHRAYDLASD